MAFHKPVIAKLLMVGGYPDGVLAQDSEHLERL